MINTDNLGIANGVLLDSPVITQNRDGSKKIIMDIMSSDMTRDEDGNRTFTKIRLQGFLPASYDGNGPYEYLHRGEEVHVEYTIKTNTFAGKTNLILQIDEIKFGNDMKYKCSDSTVSKNTTTDTSRQVISKPVANTRINTVQQPLFIEEY